MNEKKNIDLLGIGNAITDILVKVDYNFLEKMKLLQQIWVVSLLLLRLDKHQFYS